MAVADVALFKVPEAFVEVTVCSSDVQDAPAGRQKTLYRSGVQGNYGTVASLGPPRCHPSELLSRLDRGEEAWVPELQSSDESSDEGPIKPTLKQLPKGRTWWDRYRSPATYPSSDSASTDDEQQSEEEKPPRESYPRRGGYRPTILRRNLFNSSKGSGSQSLKPREASKNGLKKPSRSQLGKTKAETGNASESTTKERAAAGEGQVSCPDCGQIFKSKLSLSNHQRVHSATKAYKCPYCRERFTSKKVLDRHQRGHTAEAGNKTSYSIAKHQNIKLYECLDCKKDFKLKGQLLLHQKSHPTQQPYKCPECGKTFVRKELLVKHQHCHTTPKNNSQKDKKEEKRKGLPETVKKINSTAPVLRERTRSLNIGLTRQQQDQVNLHKCQFCGKCLRFKSLLVEHERMHREVKPYPCSQCSKSFLRERILMSHLMTHVRQAASQLPKTVKNLAVKSASVDSGILPTRGNSSKYPISRKIIRIQHTQCPRNQAGGTPFQCQYCEKSLSTSSKLANHEKLHRGERPYKCHKCAESFIRKHHLLRHQESHRRGRLSNHIEHVKSWRIKSHLTLPERIHNGQKADKGGLQASAITGNSCLAKNFKIPAQNYVCHYCGKCMKTKSSFVNHGKTHRRKQQADHHPECRKDLSPTSHQQTCVGKNRPLCSDSKFKKITKDPPKPRVPHRRKFPCFCQKCGEAFDDNYSFARHQRIHSGTKPYKCASCGRGFIQMWHMKSHQRIHLKDAFPENNHMDQWLFKCAMCGKGFFQAWHLKRHKRIHLNEKWRQQSTVMEVGRAFSDSLSGTASEKDQGDPLGKAGLQAPCRIAEVVSLPPIQKERRDPLVVLEESSDPGAPEDSEQKAKRSAMQVELSRNFKENILPDYREVSQAVKSAGKPRRKSILSIHRPRNCSKNLNSQSPKKEKNQAGWQLRSQASSRRKSKREMQLSGKRAKRCFCQQEEQEMVPQKKLKPFRKVKYCAGPQSSSCTSVSSRLLQGASQSHKPRNFCLESPCQKTISREGQMKVTKAIAQRNTAFLAQERESAGVNSGSFCEEEKRKLSDVRDPAEALSRPQASESKTQQRHNRFGALNGCPNAAAQDPGTSSLARQLEERRTPLGIQNSVEGQSCVELQTAASRELQSTPSKGKPVADQQRLETSQAKHVCSRCQKSFRSRDNLLIHEKNHTGGRPFPCTQCEKGFFALPSLNIHMRIHTGEKPFKCPECDFRCNVLGNLNTHKRLHSQESLHPCMHCGKSFRLEHKLMAHLKFRGKKQVYACPSCERVPTHRKF